MKEEKMAGRPQFEDEKRNSRLNVLITPSLKEKLTFASKIENKTINALIFDLLSDYVDANSEQIETYKETYEKFQNELNKKLEK